VSKNPVARNLRLNRAKVIPDKRRQAKDAEYQRQLRILKDTQVKHAGILRGLADYDTEETDE